MKKILIAPNAFKGSLDAQKAALAIQDGFQKSNLDCECKVLPVADGGDGSLKVVSGYLEADLHEVNVRGPLGWSTTARYGWNQKTKTAIVELAEASGIRLVNEEQLDPWQSTTYGTGQLIGAALDVGAKTIYLAVGGSATVDAAIGILDALGAKFYHNRGMISQPLASDLQKINTISIDKLKATWEDVHLEILCDVTNPLLGEEGAARVFAPQKGAGVEDVAELEVGFTHLAEIVRDQFGVDISRVKHGGAAGGVAAMLYGVLNAKLSPGGESILEWAGFEEKLEWADLVITGEGHIDQQTNYGKGPGLVASKAKEAGKPVIGFSGFVDVEDLEIPNFDAVFPITNGPGSLASAMAHTEVNLERTAFQVGNLLALT